MAHGVGPGRCALITGVGGQDGSYLAELLLAKGYRVHGVARHVRDGATSRISHLLGPAHAERFTLHSGDVTDAARVLALLSQIRPDEVYHLAAQSHVRVSFDEPVATGLATGLATTTLLEAIRLLGLDCRFYQASSSEMFGDAPAPQCETTPFRPRSPYAVAKVQAYWATRVYRESYGMFAVNGILFNHESPRRDPAFVTRKITRAAAALALGRPGALHLGNLDARRDWGYAPEYVDAMWRMLQRPEPDDVVVATGVSHSVRDFLDAAFGHVGLDWQRHVRFDPSCLRPLEVPDLRGDAAVAARELGWAPHTLAPQLARLMVDADLALLDTGVVV